MRKIFLLLALIIFVGTSSVFAGPFSDVPKDHWAVEAVETLQAKGIFDGYADGTFKGNKVVSRYHLAMVTAKMLASVETNKESVSKADLKVIERLTMEFADELALMNIKVKSLENDLNDVKKSVSGIKKDVRELQDFIKNGGNDRVKISGDILVRNYTFEPKNGNHSHRTESLFRVHLDTKISEKISAHASWNVIQDNNDRAVPFATNEWNGGNKNTGDVEVAYFKFKDTFKTGDTLKVGRDWYTHGHGLVVHDFVDAISYSQKNSAGELTFNCFFNRNNSITQKDYLNTWNINIDYYRNNYKLYLGFYINNRDYEYTYNIQNGDMGNKKLEKNKKDILIEFGAKGKIGNKNSNLSFDLAGVYNKNDKFGVDIDNNNNEYKTYNLKGWLGYFAVKYDKKKDFNFKLAYTYADEDCYTSIKRNDFNAYCMREETPFEDLSSLIMNGGVTNIKDAKIQFGFTLKNADKHSFRFAFDKIREKDSETFKTDTNLITAEYRYQLSENTRIRFVYQNAKDKEEFFTPQGRINYYFTEIYSRF